MTIVHRDGFAGSEDCQNLPACLQHVSRDEMELVFLGTGSSQPAKHRNVTGIYIHMFEKGGILLDCGEGTYAQLKRRCVHEFLTNFLVLEKNTVFVSAYILWMWQIWCKRCG